MILNITDHAQVNPGLMALATPREVQEMNISLLLELPSWLEDECEFDIINLNKQPDPEPVQPTSFLVIQVCLKDTIMLKKITIRKNYSNFTFNIYFICRQQQIVPC